MTTAALGVRASREPDGDFENGEVDAGVAI